MNMIPISPAEPRQSKSGLLIVLAIILTLCLCVAVLAGMGGFSIWKITRTLNMAATATTQTMEAQATATKQTMQAQATATKQTMQAQETTTKRTMQAQATTTHVADATDRAGFEFIDQFNDNRYNWFTGNIDDEFMTGEITITNGVYNWNIDKTKHGFAWGDTKSSGRLSLNDFDLYVDARLNKDSADKLCYGLRFRGSSEFG